jgi:hypothetical protein
MSKFKVKLPNGNDYIIKYAKEYTFDERLCFIFDLLSQSYEGYNTLQEYLEDHWIWQNKFNKCKMNYEDKTKLLIERLTTFALNAELYKTKEKHKDIRTDRNMNYTYKKEIPASCCGNNIQKLVFGNALNTDIESNYEINELGNLINKFKDLIDMSENDLEKLKKVENKNINKHKKNKEYKIDKLYHRDDREISILDTISNKEYFNEKIKFENTKTGEKGYKDLSQQIENVCSEDCINDDEQYNKWLNKNIKNVCNQPILTLRKKKIKGNIGVINKNKPYISKWLSVDTDNIFEFENNKFIIDKKLKQYKVSKDNQCDMDKILVLRQDDILRFYDMNIVDITKYIKIVEGAK